MLLWRDAGLGDDKALLRQLIEETPWRSGTVTLWGRTYPQPRLIAWHGDDGISYTYSGTTLVALPWTPTLLAIRRRVEELSGAQYNSVLVNCYRDHRDSMGLHADDEPELGQAPTIASVSLGEVRTFVLRHRWQKDVSKVKLDLPSGSLLVMRGATQANWKHGIPKRSKPCGPRVNLTFRRIESIAR